MPSRSDRMRICVVGDSQMGSLRLATDAGLVDWPARAEVEFWGATGSQFREINWQGGAIRATGDALETVRKINAQQRGHLEPGDFDLFLFYGARLRVAEYFGPYLDWRARNAAWPSNDVMDVAARQFLNCTRAFRIAGKVAQNGARVLYVPAPLLTHGIIDLTGKGGFLTAYPEAVKAGAEERRHLWDCLKRVAAQDGVDLVAQPEDTVTKGVLTKKSYARDDARKNNDPGHKSPEFAARWMQDVLPRIVSPKAAA